MKWASVLLSLAASTLVAAGSKTSQQATQTFSDVTIFSPPADYTDPRTLYARTILLKNGPGSKDNVILATWENYLPNNNSNPYFPIYESTDNGKTWAERSRLYDQVNNWGARYQPFLYELPANVGNFKKGDILLAGNFIPQDLSQTKLDIYVSHDQAKTWHFVSSVARGGKAVPNNGETPVWEPFMYLYQGELIFYYSDQRDFVNNGQKLVHQTSTDLLHWGPVVNDVAYNNSDWRPGMTTVSALPNGKFFMTYEFYGAVEAAFAVYYRVADDPRNFNQAEGKVLKAADGTVPVGSPYNVWTPYGGPQGSIVVSCGTLQPVFINRNLAADGSVWEKVDTPEKVSYTRSLLVLDNPQEILIAGGGKLPPASSNTVTDSLVLVPNAPSKRSIGFTA